MHPRCLPPTLLLLALWSGQAYASTPLEAIDFSTLMSQDALVARARAQGLSSGVMRAIRRPKTPNHKRIALIDAIARSGRTPNLSRLFVRHLELTHRVGAGELTVAKLQTHEALALAYMLAREKPQTLERLGGASEVERVDPLLLINTASNRHRGDMMIALISGLLKAHHATISPKKALCDPHACVDKALSPFGSTWSVPRPFICKTLATFPSPSGVTISAHRNTCGLQDKGTAQPRIVHAPQAGAGPKNHNRFSNPTRPSTRPTGLPPGLFGGRVGGTGSPLGLPPGARIVRMPNGRIMLPPGFKLPPGLMPSGFSLPSNGQLSAQQSAALWKELRRLQAHRKRVLRSRRATLKVRANPKVIIIDPNAPANPKVEILDGSEGSKAPNKLVIP